MNIESLPTQLPIKGDFQTREVFVAGKELLPGRSLQVCNHSRDGFNWGYGGSGPAQLALAILLIFMPPDDAMKYYQDFKWNVIARLPRENFETMLDLQAEIKKIQPVVKV